MELLRRDFFRWAAAISVSPILPPLAAQAQRATDPPAVDGPTGEERSAMAKLARGFMERYDAPALSFAVGYAGAIVHKAALGLADRESNEEATPSHLFRIASLSKMITSATIFSLIEGGLIRLSDKVFGPGAVLGIDFGKPPYSVGIEAITVEHLLTHTAGGWSNDTSDPMFIHPTMNHAELIRWVLSNRPLDHPPGTHFAYSNFGYCLLGRVIEKLAGQSYSDYVRTKVLARCSVADMTIAGNTLEQRRSNEVKYYGQFGSNPYGMNVERMDSHGGWIGRPADLVQFLMHVDGFARPPSILKQRTIEIMTTASAVNPNYAKGFLVNNYNNWWHTGNLPGTTTIAVRTHGGFCWAAFTNTHRARSQIVTDLDNLNWNMVRQVKAWRL